MTKNLGIVITDGFGFRNFILSDFIFESKKQFDKVVIFSCLPKAAYDDLNLKCEVIELDVFNETFATWFFRKAKEVTHLQLYAKNNFGINDNLKLNYSKSNNPRGFATRFIYKWSKIFCNENWILRYNFLQQLTFRNDSITESYKKLLEYYKIDILFFTHQRPPYISPLIYAANKLKIKTAAFIFSWDNLASKGRMAGNFDYYLVWSNLMKNELLHFYKSINENQIGIVGTPQFEPYVLERYFISKEFLFKKFNLDINKKTILFTCNDASSENDPLYLDMLALFVINNKLTEEVNIIVRTSPAEDPNRFLGLVSKYPFLAWNFPEWKLSRTNHQETWSQRIPSNEDLMTLRGLLTYSDLCINVLSTITLDSFLFDTPVINPVFGNKKNGMFDDQKFLNYSHLEKVINSNAVTLAKNEEEFLSAINFCLSNPKFRLKEQKELLKLEIGKDLVGTSKHFAETLLNWIK